jgi:hypothetical protein
MSYIQSVSHRLTSFIIKPCRLILICLLCFSGLASSQEKLKLATCQFPVSGDISENSTYIKEAPFFKDISFEVEKVGAHCECEKEKYRSGW